MPALEKCIVHKNNTYNVYKNINYAYVCSFNSHGTLEELLQENMLR